MGAGKTFTVFTPAKAPPPCGRSTAYGRADRAWTAKASNGRKSSVAKMSLGMKFVRTAGGGRVLFTTWGVVDHRRLNQGDSHEASINCRRCSQHPGRRTRPGGGPEARTRLHEGANDGAGVQLDRMLCRRQRWWPLGHEELECRCDGRGPEQHDRQWRAGRRADGPERPAQPGGGREPG